MYKSSLNIQIFFIISVILFSISCLHLKQQSYNHLQTSSNQQQQLNYLIGLQNNYAQGISTLNTQTQTLRSRLQQLPSIDDKVKLLQITIQSQRTKISQLSSLMIPNPSQSGVQCQILTQQQQQKINQQALLLQTKIKQLTQLLDTIPDGQQKSALRTQIQKMKINLLQIQRTASSQCQQNLLYSSTVYITNLYNNPNWTLGSYTTNQLIQQYYQYYIRYSNISNCPIDRPFLVSSVPASSIQLCSRCPDIRPIFDISTKQCIACNADQVLDINTRKCIYAPRNSNYTYGNNYRLDPLSSIPVPNPTLTSCPSNAPFYNGTLCVQCSLPYYWQISQLKCYQCPANQVFSLNVHQCLSKIDKKLTILHNTQWITNDTTRVWKDRQNILNINKTTGQYSYCPDGYPFYDGIACIACGHGQQFNIDTLRCISPPVNQTYNKNLKRYITPQTNKQMDPRTPNYITSQTLYDNPNIPNCNTSYPYYDQISCIYCPQPYTIFDYDNKICTQCPYTSIYNQSLHKCIARPVIYVYGNRNYMMATDTYTIADYNATLQQAINNNPLHVPAYCQDMAMYAAINRCVRCNVQNGQYFNVQNYQCVYCDGRLDPITSKCIQRQYYFVNTAASNLIIPTNTTLQQIKSNNDHIISTNPIKYSTCPIQNPYPYNNKTICGKCPANAPLYNIQLQGCSYCPNTQAYDPQTYQCRTVIYLTNYDQNVIISAPNTLSTLYQAQVQLNRTNLTARCPLATPYTPDGKTCINCMAAAPYYDVQKGLCVSCVYPLGYSVERKGCYQMYYLTNLSAPRLLEIENYTVINVRNQQTQLRQNPTILYKDCPQQTPYAQISMCVNCSADTVYNLKTQTCDKCTSGSAYWQNTRKCIPYTNITNINSTYARIIQSDAYTLANYRAQIQRQKLQMPIQLCPNQLPYAINGICQQCPAQTPYFILQTRTCSICDNYQPNTYTCPPKPTRYPNLTNFYWITNDGNADKYINDAMRLKSIATGPICPAFYNQSNKQCIQCPIGSFYNFDTKLCQICASGTKFDINIHTCSMPVAVGTYFTNIQSSPNNLQIYGGLTLNQIQTTQRNIKQQYPNSQYCPADRPFYDDIQCIKCPEYKKYFNLRHRLCQVCLYGQALVGNDCINQSGNKVWQEPIAQNVYPFLFSKV